MTKKRARSDPNQPDTLKKWSEVVRQWRLEAAALPPGTTRDELTRRADRLEAAMDFEKNCRQPFTQQLVP